VGNCTKTNENTENENPAQKLLLARLAGYGLGHDSNAQK
jgi:hypothetical protein